MSSGRKKRPKGLASLATSSIEPANSFSLSETGSFEKGGFKIKESGIKQTPMARGDFSTLQLDQLEVMHALGNGACGMVRLAKHRQTGKLLALKAINIIADQGTRHQVLNELRVICNIEHPCLVSLLDAFYLDGNVYLALAYMDGGSLENLLSCWRPYAATLKLTMLGLPEQTIAHVLLQVLCALQYLHARGVVHRDLKPANILLATSGSIKVADFGISKNLEETFGLARSFVGTAAYMAPERLHGQDYSTESDVWSIGMIAIECANGEHPYQHARSYYDLVMGLGDGCDPPRLSAELFSQRLCAFVASCLTLRADARQTSASLLRSHFIVAQYCNLGGGPNSTHEQLAELSASLMRQWVRETFVDAAAAEGGTLPAAPTASWRSVGSSSGRSESDERSRGPSTQLSPRQSHRSGSLLDHVTDHDMNGLVTDFSVKSTLSSQMSE